MPLVTTSTWSRIMVKQQALSKKKRSYELLAGGDALYYYSGDERYKNLNGHYYDDNGHQLVCRDLSPGFLDFFIDASRNPKKQFKGFFKFLKAQPVNYDKSRFRYRAESYHLLSSESFGKTLADCCSDMAVGDTKKILLMTQNHVMAIAIENKGDNELSLKFYDPRETLVYQRMIVKNSTALQQALEQRLSKKFIMPIYVPDFNSVVLAVYPSDLSLLEDSQSPTVHYIKDLPLRHLIYHAMMFNLDQGLKAQLEKVLELTCSDSDRIKILEARRGSIVMQILWQAVFSKHERVVDIYVDVILQSKLTRTEKRYLLNDNISTFSSYFDNFLKNRSADKIKIYFNAMMKSRYPALTEQLPAADETNIKGYWLAVINLLNTNNNSIWAHKLASSSSGFFTAPAPQTFLQYLTMLNEKHSTKLPNILLAIVMQDLPALKSALGKQRYIGLSTTGDLWYRELAPAFREQWEQPEPQNPSLSEAIGHRRSMMC